MICFVVRILLQKQNLNIRVCYERVKFVNPLLASFILSAWWHGFYPGYYFLFVGCGLIIMAARKVTP